VDLTVPGTSSFLQNGILGSNTGGRVFVLSTVNGVGNWYHEKYLGAIAGTNSFNAIDITWQDHPEYCRHEGYEHLYEEMMRRDPPINVDDWERTTKSNMSPKQWRQEYECVDPETIVTVQDEQGNIFDLSVEELYSRLNNP
jgi:hypothetical protein